MRRLVAVAILSLSVVAAGCGAQRGPAADPDVAALVNGEAIPLAQLAELVEARKAVLRSEPGTLDIQGLTRDLLKLMIQADVALDGARVAGAEVTEAQVDQRVQEIRDQAAAQGIPFDGFLREQGLTGAILRYQVRIQLVREALGAKLEPPRSDAELYQEMVRQRSQYLQARVRYVLLPDLATANRVRQALVRTGDWRQIAQRYSFDERTRAKGGDAGFHARGQDQPAFERVLFQLADQGNCRGRVSGPCRSPISRPVRTDDGWFVMQVTAVRLPELTDELRYLLDPGLEQRRLEAFLSWLQDQLERADVRINPRFGRWDPATREIVDLPTALRPPPTQPPGLGGAPGPEPGT